MTDSSYNEFMAVCLQRHLEAIAKHVCLGTDLPVVEDPKEAAMIRTIVANFREEEVERKKRIDTIIKQDKKLREYKWMYRNPITATIFFSVVLTAVANGIYQMVKYFL